MSKRIGTVGTHAADADSICAVMRYFRPEIRDLLEELHAIGNIATLLSAADLAMSGIRLAAVTWRPPDGEPVPDMENPSTEDFLRLLRRGDFLSDEFLLLMAETRDGSAIVRLLNEVHVTLLYRGEGDIGLPKQAFPLLKRPLVQVLLRLAHVGYLVNGQDRERREDVLRLVLYWLVAVTDPQEASRLAYKVIKENRHRDVRLGRAIHDRLVDQGASIPLPEIVTPLGYHQRRAGE